MESDDPIELAWMDGFPPAADKLVRFDDGTYGAWPQFRWSANNMEQLVPTKSVWRGSGAARPLRSAPRSFDHLDIELADGRHVDWAEMLDETHTDGLAILHRGELVNETYLGAADPHKRHTMMSCNKSMVGTIAECLIDDGRLDDEALVPTIVPELADSAWGDATVRQVLDMVIGMRFHEDYLDPKSDVWRFMRSTGMVPGRPDELSTVADVLPTIAKDGEHGTTFAYREPNIFVLGWIVRRAAGTDIATLASEMIWQHVGAEHDWLYMVDGAGAETTAMVTLRDFVRFGHLFCNRGVLNGHQIIPEAAIAAILGGGDQETFRRSTFTTLPGWSYRSQWWYRHIDRRICPTARGAYGQMLYIDPTNELVIARFGSARNAPSVLLDPIMWPTVDAITAELAAL